MKKLVIITFISIILLVSCGEHKTVKSQIKPWPEGHILYQFSQDITPIHRKKLEAVFNNIEENTKCVYFIKSENKKAIQIQYATDQINWASTGYCADNFIKINKVMSWRAMYHETLHTLGITHEHQRPDRDNHISILYNNIYPKYVQYFDIVEPLYNIDNIEYDTCSIMHYNQTAFSDTQSILFCEDDYIYSQEPTDNDYKKIIDIYRSLN